MGQVSSKKHIWVNTETVDSYVKRKNLKVDLIKMDIEGYEGHVIRGAKTTLKNAVLLTEFTASRLKQCGDDPQAVAKTFLRLYRYCYIIDERKRKLLKVDDAKKLSKLENNNLLLSNKSIGLEGLTVTL
jgi:hypothetical protein